MVSTRGELAERRAHGSDHRHGGNGSRGIEAREPKCQQRGPTYAATRVDPSVSRRIRRLRRRNQGLGGSGRVVLLRGGDFGGCAEITSRAVYRRLCLNPWRHSSSRLHSAHVRWKVHFEASDAGADQLAESGVPGRAMSESEKES
jgi:hypothetical protein